MDSWATGGRPARGAAVTQARPGRDGIHIVIGEWLVVQVEDDTGIGLERIGNRLPEGNGVVPIRHGQLAGGSLAAWSGPVQIENDRDAGVGELRDVLADGRLVTRSDIDGVDA